jgi:NAD(P)-dependent dehydrogenase (short-subunit alcohol dehydrogenase family)
MLYYWEEIVMSGRLYYKDKICIVTGANSGIGYAVSEELLRRGAIVHMTDRDPEINTRATGPLSTYKDQVHTRILDVTDQGQVQKVIEETASQAGRLDILFNNAGVGGTTQYEKTTLKDWKTIIDVNLWSVIYGVHYAVPIMLKQGFGHIVNTGSIAGLIPAPFQALYSLTKFGVTGLTESLKYEYAAKGLRFSVVCPANIATPIFNKGIDGKPMDGVKLRIPDDAYPADKAAALILDRVAENKGVIIVPETGQWRGVPWTEFWRRYVLGELDELIYQEARDRRASYETKGTYF